jgi:TIR domain
MARSLGLIPGTSWQQEMAKGLEGADTCAVFLGKETPRGWFQQEIEKALNRQASNPGFRVIPVLLPEAPSNPTEIMPGFLDLRTWADFREGSDSEYAFNVLVSGIKGTPVGRWPIAAPGTPISGGESRYEIAERKLKEFRKLRAAGEISDAVRRETEHKILSPWLEE